MLSLKEYITEQQLDNETYQAINEGVIKDATKFLKDNIKKLAVSAAVAASILNPASVKATEIQGSSSDGLQVLTAQVMQDNHPTGEIPPAVSGNPCKNSVDALNSALSMLSKVLDLDGPISFNDAMSNGLITNLYQGKTQDSKVFYTFELTQKAMSLGMNKKNGDKVVKAIKQHDEKTKKQDFSNDKEMKKIIKKVKEYYGKKCIVEFTNWHKLRSSAGISASMKMNDFAQQNGVKLNKVRTGTMEMENEDGTTKYIGYVVLPGY